MFRLILAATILVLAMPAGAQEDLRAPIRAELDSIQVREIIIRPSLLKQGLPGAALIRDLPSRGGCPPVTSTHTDSDWGPGEYILQAGFAQGESAAASYQMGAADFPLKLDSVEMMFATSNAIVQTTTEWSVRIYSGIPSTGTLVAEWSSDDVLLPHLVMPPGTTGVILLFTVDPDDPDQIYIDDDGSHRYSVGYRIDAHNQPGSPCISAPDPNYNAFPCTDVSGLASPAGNWIDMVTGLFCVCGEGWSTFQSLPSICRPTGDWVLRSTATPQDCITPTGACCRTGGTCTDDMTEEEKEAGFWNLQTASGIGLIGVGSLYSLQLLGLLRLGSPILQNLVQVLPIFAAVLIMLTGFGVLSWSPAARRRKSGAVA